MLISKTPYRISFFGGGTDYPQWYLKNGGEVLSATINKYIYISCRKLPGFFRHNYRIVYSKIENKNKINQIKHSVIREALLYFKKKNSINEGLEIHYDGELPARSGMGSSSSFIVGLLKVLYQYCKIQTNAKFIANQSILFERKILKEIVGSQDQVAASYGGFSSIKFEKNGNFKIIPIFKSLNDSFDLSKNIFIVYTDINRTAKFVAKSYVNKLTKEKENQMYEIIKHVKIAKSLLKKKSFDDFGKLLNETWNIKRTLSNQVSNNYIDELYKFGLDSGALGGKLLGAGGGGFILFYVQKNKRKSFLKKMEKNIVVPIRFTSDGSKIIYED